MQIDFIFSILILIFSVVVHEVSHGYVAFLQGDNTAKFAGRLTLNPLKHLEWFGSFLLPLMSYFFGGFIIGWAKPVPFNLIPIPPLDGSKILFSILPNNMQNTREFLERNGLFILIFFIFFLWRFLLPLVSWEFMLITGLTA